ncbi:hypothetical protein ACHAW5_000169 [Stephanodiscus triporus]|uniref:C2H2-type domain-containing protein n=1 Tax=Stephanodiscus triporus TaxID=2934178 RepID=A0ABD3P3Z4_9STRA
MTRLIAFLVLILASAGAGAASSSLLHTPPGDSVPTSIAGADDNSTTNSTATESPTKAAAPSPAPKPTDPPTHAPSKKYEIPNDDDDSEAEKIEKEIPKIGKIFLYVALVFVSIWLVCYFRDAIAFFFGNAWNSTRRHGCKGCLQSFFPCVWRSHSSRGHGDTLDQIIFETDDNAAPLLP